MYLMVLHDAFIAGGIIPLFEGDGKGVWVEIERAGEREGGLLRRRNKQRCALICSVNN
jgi:hypothetical protein